ncbi:MAG: hypothetical protein AAF620_00095 [Bacteroidota bacterium]
MELTTIIAIGSVLIALEASVISYLGYKRSIHKDSKEEIEKRLEYRLKINNLEKRVLDIENKALVEIKQEIRGLRQDIKGVLDEILNVYKGK